MQLVTPPIKKKFDPPKKYGKQFIWARDDKVYKNTVQNWYQAYSVTQYFMNVLRALLWTGSRFGFQLYL